MAGNSIAEGSLVLTLDATALNSGMKTAAAKAKVQGSEVGKNFKGSANEQIGTLFGGNSVLAGAGKVGLVGAGVAAAAFIGKEVYDATVKLKAYNRELEAGQRILERWAEASKLRFTQIKEKITEFNDVAGTATGLKNYAQQLQDAEKQLSVVGDKLKQTRSEEASYDSKWGSEKNRQLYLNSKLESTAADAAASAKRLQTEYDTARKSVDEMARAFRRLKDPMTNPEARTALRQFTKSQDDAVKDLTRTADEAALDKLKEQFGFKDEHLWAARFAVEAKNVATATKEATDMVKTLADEIEELAAVTKKTDDEKKLEDLIARNADDAAIDRLRELIDYKKRLNLLTTNAQYQPLSALEKGTSAEISFRNKSDFEAMQQSDAKALQDLVRQEIGWLRQIAVGVAKIKLDAPEI